MFLIVQVDRNQKTRFTRTCIAQAILILLETTEFEKLKVSDIIRKAGVARQTFYTYYHSPYEALTDYLGIIISEYIEESSRSQSRETYMQYEHILYSLRFFDRYADFFLLLYRKNLYSIMINGINAFMEEHIQTRKQLSVYQLYSYAGGLLNTFLQWERRGKIESAEEIARKIAGLYGQE